MFQGIITQTAGVVEGSQVSGPGTERRNPGWHSNPKKLRLDCLNYVTNYGILLWLDDPSEEQKEEFMHEIEQMKLLGAHQNIVSLVGCCTLQEHKFLVIEYVPFGDLLQWLRSRRRSVRE